MNTWPYSQGKDRDKYFIIFLTHLQKYGTFQSEERQLFFAKKKNWHYNHIEHMNLK
jgi:hypothetical protein